MSYREGIDITPGGFSYQQAAHTHCGSNSDRQSIGDPGHCEDCCAVGHVVAHPDLGCGDVGCYADHDDAVPSGVCRRITDPAPEPYAVRKDARQSCIEMLAGGWINPPDLCRTCTQTFMRALGAAVPNLDWHPNYRARATEGVAQ